MEVESVASDIHIVSCFGSSVYRRWDMTILHLIFYPGAGRIEFGYLAESLY